MLMNDSHPVKQLLRDHKVESDEIIIFVDESGDCKLKDPNNKVFILAACIALGATMDKVASDWSFVREAICGDRDKFIHFKDRGRRLRKFRHQIELCEFFNNADIGRLAVALTEAKGIDLTNFHGGVVIKSVFDELLVEYAKLIKYPYSQLVIIFEDSPMMRRVYELCKDLTLERSDGVSVILKFFWITKASNTPWMEMADGMAHTLAGKIRATGTKSDFDARYQAIFNPLNKAPALSRKLVALFSMPAEKLLRVDFTKS